MAKRLIWVGLAAVVLVVVLAAAQLVRPRRANPPIDPSQTIAVSLPPGAPLVAILDRACADCHSNAARWTGAERIAPLSWLMAEAVSTGRKAVNFSEWARYTPAQQAALLAQSCKDAADGKMPGSVWTLFHPEARLSASDIQAICAAARQG